MAVERTIYDDIYALQEAVAALQVQTITSNTDLNELTEGRYVVPTSSISSSLSNKPTTSTATAYIDVVPAGADGQLIMKYHVCTKDSASYYQRAYYAGAWGAWHEVNLYDSGWINLTLQNGATAFDSAQTPQYRKIGNVVYLRGVYKNVITTETVVATLPTAFRPSQRLILACVRTSTALDRIEIETDGTINYMSTTGATPVANTWHSLASISFAI